MAASGPAAARPYGVRRHTARRQWRLSGRRTGATLGWKFGGAGLLLLWHTMLGGFGRGLLLYAKLTFCETLRPPRNPPFWPCAACACNLHPLLLSPSPPHTHFPAPTHTWHPHMQPPAADHHRPCSWLAMWAFRCWEASPVPLCGARAWECAGAQHVLPCMWILRPNQASSLQGCRGVNGAILAVKNWGIGSGWQQSKQNWALRAVVGK